MGNQLAECLVKKPPRELSGSMAANRFDFQKDWVLCSILELHLTDKDYLIVCDYHEDVIILDSDKDPQSATFFQIKTKVGNHWTLQAMLVQKKGKDGSRLKSIIGKLYHNYLLAPEFTDSLKIVSNAHFKMKLSSGKDSIKMRKIICNDLDDSELEKITAILTNECKIPISTYDIPQVCFEVTPLSVDDHTTHAKGKMEEFLDKLLPEKKHAVTAAYRALFDEIRNKTAYEKEIFDFDEFKVKKGISRTAMNNILSIMGARVDLDLLWEEIRERLIKEEASLLSVRKMRLAWEKYEIERMDATNEALQELRMNIVAHCQEILGNEPDITITALLDLVLSRVKTTASNHYTREFISAITLLEGYESIQLSEADSEPQEEA